MADRKGDEFIKALEGLPENAKWAIFWAVNNMQIIEQLCRNPGMTRQELEKGIEDARAEKDYIKLVLLGLARPYLGEE